MPPITFIEAAAAETDGDSLTLPVPLRARPGDLLLGVLLVPTGVDVELPDGWAQIALGVADAIVNADVWIIRRRVDDPEPASHPFTVDVTASDSWGAVLLYRGLAETDVVDAAAEDQASSTSHKVPGVTAATYSDMLLCVWGAYSALAWTSPGTVSERFNAENPEAGSTARLVIADKLREITGPMSGPSRPTATVAGGGCSAIACSFNLAADPPPLAVSIVRPTPGAIGITEV